MRTGPARGETATLEVTVTEDMTAVVAGEQVHPVYGTAALVGHIEQVCRSLLVPHLEDDEEGVGYRIDVTQRSPVPVGARLTLTAEVARVGPRELVCQVVARRGGTIVASGSFEQRVVDLAEFRAALAATASEAG